MKVKNTGICFLLFSFLDRAADEKQAYLIMEYMINGAYGSRSSDLLCQCWSIFPGICILNTDFWNKAMNI